MNEVSIAILALIFLPLYALWKTPPSPQSCDDTPKRKHKDKQRRMPEMWEVEDD